jgi:hypothetical protein
MLTNQQSGLVELSILFESLEATFNRVDDVLCSELLKSKEDVTDIDFARELLYDVYAIVENILEKYFKLYEIDHLNYLKLEKEWLAERKRKCIFFPPQYIGENGYFPAI